MSHLFALIFGDGYWVVFSAVIRALLRLRGIQVGHGVMFRGVPRLKIRGRPEDIIIEDGVSILGDIDLRNREKGKIILRKGATIEGGCRFVAAQLGIIDVGQNVSIGTGAILNAGSDIFIGEHCVFAARVSINSSDHLHARNARIKDQGFVHAPVHFEDDCWIGVNVVITKGVSLGKGAIVGANAVVTHDVAPYSINVGVPARSIGERS